MVRVKTDHELLAEKLGWLSARLVACREAASGKGSLADRLASAVGEHLAAVNPDDLPETARVIWVDRIARPLKADPTKPLEARAVAAIRASPSARVTGLVEALAEIEEIVRAAEIDARNEVILAEISRSY